MSLTESLVVLAVVVVFSSFLGLLVWGWLQTRDIDKPSQ